MDLSKPPALKVDRKTANTFWKYNLRWPKTVDPASAELDMISHGGMWKKSNGELAGNGLDYHFKEFIRIVWPDVVFHKWFELILNKYHTHRSIAILGPASSGKTFSSALISLVDYFAHPSDTTVICCSTTKERLQDRVWADIVKRFRLAKRERQWMPGHLIEGRLRIITDSRKDSPDGRDFRNGIVGVPCKRGESFVGLADFAGIKNKRVRLLGDELSLLPKAFVDAISNLDKNEDFKIVGLGNPKDATDALGLLAEPAPELGGWDGGIDQSPGTKTWPTRRDGGIAIQLPGDDSPNLDGTLGIPLITQAAIDRDVSFYGKDSLWFTMMNMGRLPKNQGTRRVLTKQICLKFHAFDEPVWRDSNQRSIAFLDAAYGGGDRCIFGVLKFGLESLAQNTPDLSSSLINPNPHNGRNRQLIHLSEIMLVPINVGMDKSTEDQIAEFVKTQCEARNIPPEDFFFDSGMRTTLVLSFARLWSVNVQSVDCGGPPTDQNVSSVIATPCKDYYSKFVTELWFSVRLAVESDQFRGMTDSVCGEFCSREWTIVGANKIEVEPKASVKLKCFVAGTLVETPVGRIPIEQLRPGDLVQTPFGVTRIAIAHANESSDLFEILLSDGTSLIGTGDHEIFSWSEGWIPIRALSLCSILESAHDIPSWKILNMLFTREKDTTFKHLAATIREGGRRKTCRRGFYTELSGLNILEKFRSACAYTIKMAIGETMTSLIWNLWTFASTRDFTWPPDGRIPVSEAVRASGRWKRLRFWLNGGGRSWDAHLGVRSLKKCGKPSAEKDSGAKYADVRIGHTTFTPSFAPPNALIPSITKGITTSLQCAWSVLKSLWRNATLTDCIAVKSVRRLPCGKSEKVYDLTLCEHNVYYANGVLVSNCGRSPDEADAVAIGLFGARKRGFIISRLQPDKPPKQQTRWRDDLRKRAQNLSYAGQLEYAK